MLLRPFLNDSSLCASDLFGWGTHSGHYAGPVCGRGLSGNPVSSIGLERAHDPLLALADPATFAEALLAGVPPPPPEQERIVAAKRSGRVGARA